VLFGLSSFAQPKKWTLQECVEYALKNNISVKNTELDSRLALVDKKDAFGNFLPSINGSASHSWNIGLNQNITTGLLENQTTQFTSAGVTVGMNIFSGLQNQHRMRRATMGILAAQYRLSKMQDDVALNVANAYLQILFNKENLKVQQEQLANNTKQQERTQELVNAGSVARGDLMDMQATVAANQQAVIAAENALLISKLSLAQLLQIEDYENFDVADVDYETSESEVMSEAPSAIVERAKEARMEIKIAKTNLEIAERDVKIAKSAYSPTLSGFYNFSTRAAYADQIRGFEQNTLVPTTTIGTVDVSGTTYNVVQPNLVPILGRPDSVWEQFDTNKGHSFGLQLIVLILNGFSTRNNIERSKVALERNKIALSQAELDLERNVYTAFTDAKGALKAYEAAVSAAEAREEAFNYARERYAVGLMNAFDFNQAQTLYVNSQSDVVRAKYDYIFKVKVVEFYFGVPITQLQ